MTHPENATADSSADENSAVPAEEGWVEGEIEQRRLGVSRLAFYGGSGIMMWTGPETFTIYVKMVDEGELRDVTEELGELVALGWEWIGLETGVVDDDPVQIAEVSAWGTDGSERFYIINLAERGVIEITLEQVLRSVAVAVKRLIEDGIAQRDTRL